MPIKKGDASCHVSNEKYRDGYDRIFGVERNRRTHRRALKEKKGSGIFNIWGGEVEPVYDPVNYGVVIVDAKKDTIKEVTFPIKEGECINMNSLCAGCGKAINYGSLCKTCRAKIEDDGLSWPDPGGEK